MQTLVIITANQFNYYKNNMRKLYHYPHFAHEREIIISLSLSYNIMKLKLQS